VYYVLEDLTMEAIEAWRIEADRIKQRDATIMKGMESGVDSIAEKQASAMCFNHPGLVYPRVNREVFAEVKACIVEACLKAQQEGSIEMLESIRATLISRSLGINSGGDIGVMEAVDAIVQRESK
jgi:hypothetical protein